MATTSPPLDLDLAAKLFRGLGDRSRLSILQSLLEGPRNVTEVVDATGLSQSNVSNHLSCLYCCGLVLKAQRGRFVYYRLSSREVRDLLRRAERLLQDVGGHIDECDHYGAPAARRTGA